MLNENNENAVFFQKSNDLRNRVLFTILILSVYRLGTYVPLPGIDPESLKTMMDSAQRGLLGMFNIFSGGAVGRMAIFALGIMPYISSSIIIQLLTGVSETFKNLKKQGELGRKKITQYTRYGTVLLATIQGYGVAVGLESSQIVIIDSSGYFKLTTVITLVAGTIFLMWLGEQITQRGIGNGISLIIFSGIVAEIPRALATTFELGRTGALSASIIILIFIIILVTVAFIVFVERAIRKILINYPKRQMGTKIYGGESSHLPSENKYSWCYTCNICICFIITSNNFFKFWIFRIGNIYRHFIIVCSRKTFVHDALCFWNNIFSFFYTSIVFNPKETAENLRKHGGYVPGIRPGERTAYFIEDILTKLTTIGALYLTLVCLMPEFLISRYPIPFYLGGTSVLIVVVVAMDTVSQIQTRLMSQQYESLIKKTRFGK